MQQVTIKQAKVVVRKYIEHSFENNLHMPIYMHSSPGIGKSSIVKQIAIDMNIGFVDLRLASMEASDVCGIPYVSHAGNSTETMKHSVPEWFPTPEKVQDGVIPEKGIVFFDELSNAPIGVQHAGYRVILDRELQSSVKMADGWLIVAAGNLKTDKTGAKPVAPALANRFATHLEIKADLSSFVEYAYGVGIDKKIIGFLSFKSDALYKFDPAKNDVAFATPRSWEQCSNILKMKGLSKDMLYPMIAGCVGEGPASELVSFIELYGKLPNFEKIMDGTEEYTVPKNDMGLLFAVCTSTIDAMLSNADNTSRLKNLQKIIKQVPDDFAIMIFKTIKGIANSGQLSKIVVHSLENFQRVSKYLK